MDIVGARELKAWIDDPHAVLQMLDVREPWEYELCRIAGTACVSALHIPMAQIPARLHELDRTRATVVVCHHGVRSAHVAQFLERQGFQTINLRGGIDAWAREIDHDMALY